MKTFLLWCRRYVSIPALLVLAAIIYLVFFQDNSMGRIYQYERTIDSLQAVIADNRDTLMYYRNLNERLNNRDPEIIERVVRENHNMNLINEDVYIFE